MTDTEHLERRLDDAHKEVSRELGCGDYCEDRCNRQLALDEFSAATVALEQALAAAERPPPAPDLYRVNCGACGPQNGLHMARSTAQAVLKVHEGTRLHKAKTTAFIDRVPAPETGEPDHG